jgi:nitrogen fixation protein NifX
MKIAFTSTDGKTVDQHFGMATAFHLFEIGPESSVPAGTVGVIAVGEDEEDRIAARANAVAGCVIVYTMQIGGPAAAKLVARKIQPMKTGTEVAISDLIGRLQEALRGTPPPWLRKAMNPGGRPSFIEDEFDNQ